MLIQHILRSSAGACLMVSILGVAPAAAQSQTSESQSPQAVAASPSATQATSDSAPAAGHSVPTPDTAPTQTRIETAAQPPIFAPFDTGRRWAYVYVRERTRTMAGGVPQIERLRGTLIQEVAGPAPELGRGVVRMQSSLNGKLEGEATAKIETSNAFYASQGTSFQLVAEEVKDPVAGNSKITRYLEPLRLLESQVAVGHTWTVGVRQEGQLQTDLHGEVMGVQDVQTPKGVFERCLVVRLTGKITGVVEAYGSRMEVPDGHYEATVWYAPGVGRVLSKVEMTQKLVLEDGQTLDYVERTQYALRSFEQAAPTLQAPTPAATPAAAQPAGR